MKQQWYKLLFAHWPLAPDVLRPLIPQGLQLDTFDGQAWIGVVPFIVTGLRARWLPPIPGTSTFPELNVRTYVTHDGKPGVWFFSLDAANRLAVRGARLAYHLPYYDAEMSAEVTGDHVRYRSRRTHKNAAPAEFVGSYRPIAPPMTAQVGTLDYFLTERYCLYTADKRGRLYRSDIQHAPWPLQKAEAEIQVNTMTEPHGIGLPDVPPLLHYSAFQDVKVWYVRRV
jgi:uncharacterized protein YqjF (DUF2071 family)